LVDLAASRDAFRQIVRFQRVFDVLRPRFSG